MKTNSSVPQLPLATRTGSATLDVVVPFTTRSLTRAALSAAGRLSANLHPLVRLVRTQIVPFPLQLDSTPVPAQVIRQQLAPLAEEFGADLQICFTRDTREGLKYVLSRNSLIVIASPRRWWKTREQRLAAWLSERGYSVVLEFVEKNHA